MPGSHSPKFGTSSAPDAANDPSQAAAVYQRVVVELYKQALHEQGQLVMKLNGTSMAPTLLPGDWIVVKPASLNEVRRGEMVVFQQYGHVYTHRLVSIFHGQLLTRGDRCLVTDPLFLPEALLGKVDGLFRNGKRMDSHLSWKVINSLFGWMVRVENLVYRAVNCVKRRG